MFPVYSGQDQVQQYVRIMGLYRYERNGATVAQTFVCHCKSMERDGKRFHISFCSSYNGPTII